MTAMTTRLIWWAGPAAAEPLDEPGGGAADGGPEPGGPGLFGGRVEPDGAGLGGGGGASGTGIAPFGDFLCVALLNRERIHSMRRRIGALARLTESVCLTAGGGVDRPAATEVGPGEDGARRDFPATSIGGPSSRRTIVLFQALELVRSRTTSTSRRMRAMQKLKSDALFSSDGGFLNSSGMMNLSSSVRGSTASHWRVANAASAFNRSLPDVRAALASNSISSGIQRPSRR